MAEEREWRRVRTEDGTWTLAHPEHGEACHSTVGARLESLERYVEGCELPRRWRLEAPRTWRILDIGTGVGWNLAAALEARLALELETLPRMELVTLEVSRSVLESSFALARDEPQGESLAWVHTALVSALALEPGRAVAVVPGVSLRLVLGDAREAVRDLAVGLEEPFDAFFLDPFSPRREPGLWTADFFESLGALAAPDARLATYSAATHVRAGLVLAGWQVGPAPRVGRKAEGTLARWGTPLEEAFEPRIARRIARRVDEARPAGGAPDGTH